jgi:hypothetical protein
VLVEVKFVDSGEHQTVTANSTPDVSSNAATVKSYNWNYMTVDTGTWGVNDTVGVTHEFGHLIGAPDEYFTVDGVDHGAPGRLGGPVMNNPSGNPTLGNFNAVAQEASKVMGVKCTVIKDSGSAPSTDLVAV